MGLCLAGRAPALETPPVEVVVDSRMVVRGAAGDGLLPVAVSQDWSRPLPNVTRAVIIVHGAHRTAGPYFRIAKGLAPDNGTLIVAPQFLLQKDTAAHAVPENVLRWGPESWEKGGDAAGPVRVKSYEAIDASA